MKSSYSIDAEKGLIYKTHLGQVTVNEEIELLDEIFSDPKFRTGMNAICDFTGASIDWELADLDRFRVYVARINHIAGKCKWAIVSTETTTRNTARLFIALGKNLPDSIEVRLFDDARDALEWAGSAVEVAD